MEDSKTVTTEQSLRTQITLTYQLLLITRRVRFATDIIQKSDAEEEKEFSKELMRAGDYKPDTGQVVPLFHTIMSL